MINMPNKDGTGPKGQGPKDGHGKGKGKGKGNSNGQGQMTGGKKGFFAMKRYHWVSGHRARKTVPIMLNLHQKLPPPAGAVFLFP